jgi:hypothetical protein
MAHRIKKGIRLHVELLKELTGKYSRFALCAMPFNIEPEVHHHKLKYIRT